jgi:hypothetical protein
MVTALDQALHQSLDPPDGPSLVVSHRVMTGRPGRPRIEFDPDFLAEALDLRGPSHIAPVFHCSPMTVRRRALESGLTQPGHPVYTNVQEADGTITRAFTSSTRPVSTLTDDALDHIIASILEIFPNFGRRILSGHLKAAGHHVPRDRIAGSYLRVHGSPGVFGDHSIHRKVYRVAGANSLAHHDGQHGTLFSQPKDCKVSHNFPRAY